MAMFVLHHHITYIVHTCSSDLPRKSGKCCVPWLLQCIIIDTIFQPGIGNGSRTLNIAIVNNAGIPRYES